jgi:hypothetical protein
MMMELKAAAGILVSGSHDQLYRPRINCQNTVAEAYQKSDLNTVVTSKREKFSGWFRDVVR